MHCSNLSGTFYSLILMIFRNSILSSRTYENGCQISIDYSTGDLKEPQPLILKNSFQIMYPDQTGALKLSNKQSIFLACPGKNNNLEIVSKSPQILKANCVWHKVFSIRRKLYPFHLFVCKNRLKSVAKKSGTCLKKFSKIQIGFEIRKKFTSILEICRNNETHETYYVKAEMNKSISGYQINIPRPSWMTHYLFPGQDINYFYSKKNQIKILKKILNSKELADCYLKEYYLQRGHLAARSDFIYATEQNSTFSFANAAPQWSSFNNGNWNRIETAIRKFVVDNDLKVTIYTGVHGQMTLRDVNDKKQPIYLNIDKNNKGYMKVPQFFWKIIYEPVRHLAFAIVGVNDPFSKEITDDMFLCEDITDNQHFDWFTKSLCNRKNITQGVSYVCQYEELKKVVSTMPDLKVKSILRN